MKIFNKDGKVNKEKLSELIEVAKKEIDNQIDYTKIFSTVSTFAAPTGSLCPGCKKETLLVTRSAFGGKWSGGISCSSCDYRNSLIGYLGNGLVQVEPMPPGAQQIYLYDEKKGE